MVTMDTISTGDQCPVKRREDGNIQTPLPPASEKHHFISIGDNMAVSSTFLEANGGEIFIPKNDDENYQILENGANSSTPTVEYTSESERLTSSRLKNRYSCDVTARAPDSAG